MDIHFYLPLVIGYMKENETPTGTSSEQIVSNGTSAEHRADMHELDCATEKSGAVST